jgi:glycosyltransferase involved in cell wall biosynthesis
MNDFANPLQYTAIYAAFDVFPSSKGAATHIHYFSEALAMYVPHTVRYVLGDDDIANKQKLEEILDTDDNANQSIDTSKQENTQENLENNAENKIKTIHFFSQIPNFLHRTDKYAENLYRFLETQNELKICHFRDIWSALPIITYQKYRENYTKNDSYAINSSKFIVFKTVFEVNSLPSLELPYRYALSNSTLQKIEDLELFCLQHADAIVVPSDILRHLLLKKGIPEQKITKISNGAIVPQNLLKPADSPTNYLIYFGALQSWQGIEILLRALVLLRDKEDLFLVLCSSLKEKFSRPYQKLAEKLGIASKIIWKHQLPKNELQNWIYGAKLSIAPLTECKRNIEQGCNPLKIIESMACGVPVVASDLPVSREIITQNIDGKLVRAGRPDELARTIRMLLEEQEFCQNMGKNARQTIIEKFTWAEKQQKLQNLYADLMQL